MSSPTERVAPRTLCVVAFVVCACAMTFGQSRRVLNELGRVDPPAYAAPLVATDRHSPVFDDAVAMYTRRQYVQAAELLRRVVAIEPDDQAANYFLAVSLMMIDEVGEAEDRLGVVVAAPASPFTSPARFVLAKALIRLGKLSAAERELETLTGEERPVAGAAELLTKVRSLKKR